jgi:hypothetical protein
MARIPVIVVHNEVGRIIAIAQPSNPKAVVSCGPGQTALETEVEEDSIAELVTGKHRVDTERKIVV